MLKLENIQKQFFGKYANRNVNLNVEAGEVHALLGENGAGKTTLMNILYGLYQPDGGRIFIDGEEVRFASPKDAIEKRIGMVHQHFMLVPSLTVSQNITLGLKEKGYPLTDRAAINRRLKALSERYGLPIDVDAPVSSLSVGEQQRVEIMKLLYRDARILILDEPTAVLTSQETDKLFSVLRRLVADGCSVILITHKIPEVMKIADRVTVMRDAETIATFSISELDETRLAEAMIGRKLTERPRIEAVAENAEPGLELDHVTMIRDGVTRLDDVSFSVRRGSILGIAGVEGNGQKELAEAIVGLRRIQSGTIRFGTNELNGRSVQERRALGVAYVSDDRHHDGLLMDAGMTDNMLLKYCCAGRFRRWGLLDFKGARRLAEEKKEAYRIKADRLTTPVRYLSGGNQQKIILSRELADDPCLIVAAQPTRGLDIGASEFVRDQLLAQRRNGAAVLLISADLDEILSLSDSIAVIYNGRIMAILENDHHLDMTQIGLWMAGKDATKDTAKAEVQR